MNEDFALDTLRFAMAAMFAFASLMKLTDLAAFREVIGAIGRIPVALVPVVALATPIAELLVAVAYVVAPRTGALAGAALLALFTIVVIDVVASGRRLTCACFGPFRRSVMGARTIARNILLLILSVVVVLLPPMLTKTSGQAALVALVVVANVALVGRVSRDAARSRNDIEAIRSELAPAKGIP